MTTWQPCSRGVQFSPFSFPTHVLCIKKSHSARFGLNGTRLNTSWTVCTCASASSESEHTNVAYTKSYTIKEMRSRVSVSNFQVSVSKSEPGLTLGGYGLDYITAAKLTFVMSQCEMHG